MGKKKKSPLNRTIDLTEEQINVLVNEHCSASLQGKAENVILNADSFDILPTLPTDFYNLVILDPPYNLNKDYKGNKFKRMDDDEYKEYVTSFLNLIKPLMKSDATLYFCADWKSSIAVHLALKETGFHIHNRIVWEREKGRGSKKNWKNNTEDIFMASLSKEYYFDVEKVKLKRKVLSNYKGKDWKEENGKNVRMSYPSNIWTDITIPFWSMPENTEHPTQKPEKLIAKLVLASSKEDDNILDPFGGSGTTGSVCVKLGRNFTLIEKSKEYAALCAHRILEAGKNKAIQGYEGGVFLDRNFNS